MSGGALYFGFTLGFTILWVIATLSVFGAIGALIAESKHQSRFVGFCLGFLLGFIGLAIAALLPKSLPKPPPGRWVLECPRCNAVQNLRDEAETFSCWQCKHQEPVDDLLAR